MPSELTARQLRERAFFDEYWSRFGDVEQVNLDVIAGKETRPWNSYWHVFEAAKKLYAAGARKLLDFGCGGGTNAGILATLGYEVTGFDISPKCVATAKQIVTAHGLSDRCHFSVQASERLEYPDNYFDVVVGIDILHHVEIGSSVAECLRVLKPGGGVALFREFVEVPAFDRVRNTALVRLLFPNGKTLDHWAYITEDERKLTDQDIALIRGLCPSTTEKRFTVLARLDRLLRRPGKGSASTMEKIDYWLCNRIPALNKFGGSVVLEFHKDSGADKGAGLRN